MIVLDVTNKKSYSNLSEWMEQVKQVNHINHVLCDDSSMFYII